MWEWAWLRPHNLRIHRILPHLRSLLPIHLPSLSFFPLSSSSSSSFLACHRPKQIRVQEIRLMIQMRKDVMQAQIRPV